MMGIVGSIYDRLRFLQRWLTGQSRSQAYAVHALRWLSGCAYASSPGRAGVTILTRGRALGAAYNCCAGQ